MRLLVRSGDFSVRAYDTVRRYEDDNGVLSNGYAHHAKRFGATDGIGYFGCGARLPVGDTLQGVPYLDLEFASLGLEGQIEGGSSTREVFEQLRGAQIRQFAGAVFSGHLHCAERDGGDGPIADADGDEAVRGSVGEISLIAQNHVPPFPLTSHHYSDES